MSEPEATEGSLWDAPNQQVVREDQSPPWQEGTGAGGGPDLPREDGGDDLDAMTKAELIAYAKESGIGPANNDMTKQELIDAIRSNSGIEGA